MRPIRPSVLLSPVLCALVVACGTPLPRGESIPETGVDWIQTASPGCAPQSAEEALHDAVGDDPEALDYVRKVGAVEAAITREPLLSGNTVELLIDGPATHRAQLAAIRAAKDHIHLQVYILTDEELGQTYAKALAERARAGVKVRLMIDGLGSLGAGHAYREDLRDAGVEIAEYNTVNPIKDPRVWRINRRSHRKLLVVDGSVAFTGGVNIMDEYSQASPMSGSNEGAAIEGEPGGGGSVLGSGAGSSASTGSGDKPAPPGWRDTHIRVVGPAVAEFQREFLKDWEHIKGPVAVSPSYWPQENVQGHNLVRVVTNRGADFLALTLGVPMEVARTIIGKKKKENTIYTTYFAAIREAKHRVWITQAYFAPTRDFLELLRDDAQRGVDVRIVMPGKSDVGLLPLAARHYYQDLLEAGVKLYEYQPVMIHAKTAVVDGVWSTVGSSNLDFRSFIHNDEANAIVIGREFGTKMEKQYASDLSQSHEITLEEWRQRPYAERMKEMGAAAIKFWI